MADPFAALQPTRKPRDPFATLMPAGKSSGAETGQTVDAAAVGKLVGDAVKGTGAAAHREFLANPVGRPAWLPSPGAAVAGGVRDLVTGVARLPFDLAGAEETSKAIGEAIPQVTMPNAASSIMAALVQYGIPSAKALQLSNWLLKSAPTAAKVAGGAAAAGLSDFAATDPDKAATLGDLVGGPTALQPGDDALTRRLKVGAEGGAITGLADVLLRTVPVLVRGKGAPTQAAEEAAPPPAAAAPAAPKRDPFADLLPTIDRSQAEAVLARTGQPAPAQQTVSTGGAPRTLDDVRSETTARDLAAVGSDAGTDRLLDVLRGKARMPAPVSLVQFIRRQGGLRNEGGELSALGLTPRSLPGFINNASGKSLDDMAEAAWQAGYFGPTPKQVGDTGTLRPTIREFLDRLDGELRGRPVYATGDEAVVMELQALRNLQEAVDRSGIDLLGNSNATVRAMLAGADGGGARTAADLAREEARQAAGGAAVPDARGLKGPAERAGNINLGFIETADDVKALLKATADTFAQGLDAARRGVIGHAATARLARQLGMSEETLLARRKGRALNAEEALAARQLLTRSGEDLVELAGKARGGSEADLLAFERALAQHLAIQEQVAGLTAEAGRALSAFRIQAKSQAVRDRLIRQAIEEGGGRGKVEEIAERLLVIDNPDDVAAFVRDAWRPRFRDKLFELWINALLSGPRTHVVNVASNFLTSVWSVPENLLAAAVGVARGGADRLTGRELLSRIYGFAEGSLDGLRYAAKALKSGDSTFDPAVTKIERRRRGNAIGGALGQVARVPTRLLGAADDFFKALNYRSELHGLAMRSGLERGLRGDRLKAHVRQVLELPDDATHLRAMDQARYMTFTKELGRLGNTVMSAINQIPGGRVIVPFIRTPANLLKFAAERTPLGLAMRQVRDDIAKGGIARDQALARMTLGSSVMVAIASLADAGLVTGGGPSDPAERRLWLQDHQPYSVKVGDRWVSFQRLDPLATLLGVAADFVQLWESLGDPEGDRLGALLVGSVVNNLLDKTWLRGPAELVQAVTDPERYGQGWLQSLAGTLVPTGVAQLAQHLDPVMRDRSADRTLTATDPLMAEARTLLNAVLGRIPGQTQALPPVRDVWGQPVVRETLGPSIVSPFPVKDAKPDLPSQELRRLGYFPSRPSRTLQGVPLSPQEYDRLAELAGQQARVLVEALMAAQGWQTMPDPVKRDALELVFRKARENAALSVLLSSPELVRRIVAKHQADADALGGGARR